jgi:hypothetical protein
MIGPLASLSYNELFLPEAPAPAPPVESKDPATGIPRKN